MLTRCMQEENEKPERNTFKVRAFASAVSTIGNLEQPIQSPEDTNQLSGIGNGIKRRIEIFLTEGSDVLTVSLSRICG
ncbi:hypothetical protein AcV5_007928 [Taiwanofungus camphoratus]|nr:hypothetical protein AcV7_006071 [Antrodia cinnamomea]KAI0927375.1 hypothetical protein AcV5_007928 [Antrodia cinnamomea]